MHVLALSFNEDILGLQIKMVHALLVTVLDRIEYLTKDMLDLLRRTFALELSPEEFVEERSTGAQTENDEEVIFEELGVVDVDDAGVGGDSWRAISRACAFSVVGLRMISFTAYCGSPGASRTTAS